MDDCEKLPQGLRCGYCKVMSKAKMPPIGIMPRRLWEEKRFYDLQEAIERYVEGGFPVPTEWIEEYNDFIKNH